MHSSWNDSDFTRRQRCGENRCAHELPWIRKMENLKSLWS